VTVNPLIEPSTGETVAVAVAVNVSSRIGAGFGITFSVGCWLTAVTLTVKLRVMVLTPPLAVPPLSVIVTKITADPLTLATGV